MRDFLFTLREVNVLSSFLSQNMQKYERNLRKTRENLLKRESGAKSLQTHPPPHSYQIYKNLICLVFPEQINFYLLFIYVIAGISLQFQLRIK